MKDQDYLQQSNFNIEAFLLPYCKKTIDNLMNENKSQDLEIDFVVLQKKLEQYRQYQTSACQQIVNVVDDHLEEFCQISKKLEIIQQHLSTTDKLYQNLLENVEECKKQSLHEQSKLKEIVQTYEINQIEATLLEQCLEFLDQINSLNTQFQKIKDIDYQNLSIRQQNILIKFCYHNRSFNKIFNHHICLKYLKGFEIGALLENLQSEVEIYLCQQLTKLIFEQKLSSTNKIKLCLKFMNKEQEYYNIIQEHLVWSELRVVQNQLISHKTNIISQKQETYLNNFFKNLFQLISKLPDDYPVERIQKLVTGFLGKKQLNFLYTYTLFIFPISFSYYKKYLTQLKNQNIIDQIHKNHKWNIKMWADVRTQQILKRSLNDDLLKWIDIIFKPQCLIEGVKSKMVKLALIIISRYCQNQMNKKITIDSQYIGMVNQIVEYEKIIPKKIEGYIKSCFDKEDVVDKLILEIKSKIHKSLLVLFENNLKIIVNTCINSLESVNNILTKLVQNPKLDSIHSATVVFKSLHSYLRNNPNFTSQSQQKIRQYVIAEVKKKYELLKNDINQIGVRTLTTTQMSRVMQQLYYDEVKLF